MNFSFFPLNISLILILCCLLVKTTSQSAEFVVIIDSYGSVSQNDRWGCPMESELAKPCRGQSGFNACSVSECQGYCESNSDCTTFFHNQNNHCWLYDESVCDTYISNRNNKGMTLKLASIAKPSLEGSNFHILADSSKGDLVCRKENAFAISEPTTTTNPEQCSQTCEANNCLFFMIENLYCYFFTGCTMDRGIGVGTATALIYMNLNPSGTNLQSNSPLHMSSVSTGMTCDTWGQSGYTSHGLRMHTFNQTDLHGCDADWQTESQLYMVFIPGNNCYHLRECNTVAAGTPSLVYKKLDPRGRTECEDTDNGALDNYGNGCDGYYTEHLCTGGGNNENFNFNDMCCTCGGGQSLTNCPDTVAAVKQCDNCKCGSTLIVASDSTGNVVAVNSLEECTQIANDVSAVWIAFRPASNSQCWIGSESDCNDRRITGTDANWSIYKLECDIDTYEGYQLVLIDQYYDGYSNVYPLPSINDNCINGCSNDASCWGFFVSENANGCYHYLSDPTSTTPNAGAKMGVYQKIVNSREPTLSPTVNPTVGPTVEPTEVECCVSFQLTGSLFQEGTKNGEYNQMASQHNGLPAYQGGENDSYFIFYDTDNSLWAISTALGGGRQADISYEPVCLGNGDQMVSIGDVSDIWTISECVVNGACPNDDYTGFTKLGDGFYSDFAFRDMSNPYSDATLCAIECVADSGCWGIVVALTCYHYTGDPVAGGVAWTAQPTLVSYEKCLNSGIGTVDICTPTDPNSCTACTDADYTGFDSLGDGFYNEWSHFDSSNPYSSGDACATACLADSTCWGLVFSTDSQGTTLCYLYTDDPEAAGVAWTPHPTSKSYKKCQPCDTTTDCKCTYDSVGQGSCRDSTLESPPYCQITPTELFDYPIPSQSACKDLCDTFTSCVAIVYDSTYGCRIHFYSYSDAQSAGSSLQLTGFGCIDGGATGLITQTNDSGAWECLVKDSCPNETPVSYEGYELVLTDQYYDGYSNTYALPHLGDCIEDCNNDVSCWGFLVSENANGCYHYLSDPSSTIPSDFEKMEVYRKIVADSSNHPTNIPTHAPTNIPSFHPSRYPTIQPTKDIMQLSWHLSDAHQSCHEKCATLSGTCVDTEMWPQSAEWIQSIAQKMGLECVHEGDHCDRGEAPIYNAEHQYCTWCGSTCCGYGLNEHGIPAKICGKKADVQRMCPCETSCNCDYCKEAVSTFRHKRWIWLLLL